LDAGNDLLEQELQTAFPVAGFPFPVDCVGIAVKAELFHPFLMRLGALWAHERLFRKEKTGVRSQNA
jgi:hypothetical protein